MLSITPPASSNALDDSSDDEWERYLEHLERLLLPDALWRRRCLPLLPEAWRPHLRESEGKAEAGDRGPTGYGRGSIRSAQLGPGSEINSGEPLGIRKGGTGPGPALTTPIMGGTGGCTEGTAIWARTAVVVPKAGEMGL